MYKLQTSYFGGDCTFVDATDIVFKSVDEAVEYLLANMPPSEHEWRIDDGKGGMLAWTRYGGEEVTVWKDKCVRIREHYTK